MKVTDIMHEAYRAIEGQKPKMVAWVYRDIRNKCYTVYIPGITHSTGDSSYPLNDDGLSIAVARADYFLNNV